MFEDFLFEGRWCVERDRARVSAPAASVSFAFEGTRASLELKGDARWKVELDGKETGELLSGRRNLYPVVSNAADGVHRLTLRKKTETELGNVSLYGARANLVPLPEDLFSKRPSLEFIGDSYTVGYGNAARDPITGNAFATTDASKSFGALLSQRLGATFAVNAYSGRGVVQNYMGIAPRWTIPNLYKYTLGGEAPLGTSPLWDFSGFLPKTVCLFIGINDFQGEGPHPQAQAFDTAYAEFLENLRGHYPGARFVLISTDIFPVNLLPERIESVFSRELSRGNRDVFHVHLETPHNAGLDFHPNLDRHKRMSDALYQKFLNISLEI